MTKLVKMIGQENGVIVYEMDNGNILLVPIKDYDSIGNREIWDFVLDTQKLDEKNYLLLSVQSKKLRDEFKNIPQKYAELKKLRAEDDAKKREFYNRPEYINFENFTDKERDIKSEIEKINSRYASFESHYDRNSNTRNIIDHNMPDESYKKLQKLNQELLDTQIEIEKLNQELSKITPAKIPDNMLLTDDEITAIEIITGEKWVSGYTEHEDIIAKYKRLVSQNL